MIRSIIGVPFRHTILRPIFWGFALGFTVLALRAPQFSQAEAAPAEAKPRLSMFIGVDVSGSFLKSKYYDDSLHFLAHYIFAHLNGYGGLDVPKVLFVGSLGGMGKDEPKTFFPIQTFDGKSIEQIHTKLQEIFPKKENPYTDFNAFFDQVVNIVKSKNLVLRPISIVLLSDGEPDFPRPGSKIDHNVANVSVKNMEQLSRNITVRLLYTSAPKAGEWQKKVKRQRVKVWTQDALVMEQWKEPNILVPGKPFEKQMKFFDWLKDNVDFGVRLRRVD